jgi:hypothetical protein
MWTTVVIPVVAFVACIPVILFIEHRRRRRVAGQFLRDRRPIPDEEYLKAFAESDFPVDRLLQARRVMASLCGVPPEMISAGDTLRSLLDLQFDSGWLEDFLMQVEPPPDIGAVLAAVRDEWTFHDLVVLITGLTSHCTGPGRQV